MSENTKMISAIYNYKNVNENMLFIPAIFNYEQPIFLSFIYLFKENKYFKEFFERWADYPGTQWKEILEDFYFGKEKFDMVMNLLQGAIDTIDENTDNVKFSNSKKVEFVNKVLKLINNMEKQIWDILRRGKFLYPNVGLFNFDNLIKQLQVRESRLFCNEVVLYSKLKNIVEKYGVGECKAEFKYFNEDLKTWIRKNLAA